MGCNVKPTHTFTKQKDTCIRCGGINLHTIVGNCVIIAADKNKIELKSPHTLCFDDSYHQYKYNKDKSKYDPSRIVILLVAKMVQRIRIKSTE